MLAKNDFRLDSVSFIWTCELQEAVELFLQLTDLSVFLVNRFLLLNEFEFHGFHAFLLVKNNLLKSFDFRHIVCVIDWKTFDFGANPAMD